MNLRSLGPLNGDNHPPLLCHSQPPGVQVGANNPSINLSWVQRWLTKSFSHPKELSHPTPTFTVHSCEDATMCECCSIPGLTEVVMWNLPPHRPHSIKCPLTLPCHHVKGIFLQTCPGSLHRAKPTLIIFLPAFLRAVAFSQHSWKAFLHSGEPFTLVSLFSQENLMGFSFMPSSQHFCRSVFRYLLAAI